MIPKRSRQEPEMVARSMSHPHVEVTRVCGDRENENDLDESHLVVYLLSSKEVL